jgi:hypothetical protein
MDCRQELFSRLDLALTNAPLTFLLFRLSQHLIQKRAEVGLDDVEFSLKYPKGFRKIVENGCVEAHSLDRLTADWLDRLNFPITLSARTVGRARLALSTVRLCGAGKVLTPTDIHIGPRS